MPCTQPSLHRLAMVRASSVYICPQTISIPSSCGRWRVRQPKGTYSRPSVYLRRHLTHFRSIGMILCRCFTVGRAPLPGSIAPAPLAPTLPRRYHRSASVWLRYSTFATDRHQPRTMYNVRRTSTLRPTMFEHPSTKLLTSSPQSLVLTMRRNNPVMPPTACPRSPFGRRQLPPGISHHTTISLLGVLSLYVP
jgi:hypothetical protein